jgi:hypothetical protein
LRLDGETLVVRIPMRFQRRCGRKRIVAPDGSELTPTSKPQPLDQIVRDRDRKRRRMLLDLARNYLNIPIRAHREAIAAPFEGDAGGGVHDHRREAEKSRPDIGLEGRLAPGKRPYPAAAADGGI